MSKAFDAQALIALHRAGLISRRTSLTCAGKTDGGGAQIHAAMSVLAFCRDAGLPYSHTPLQTVEHASDGAPAATWERLFNLGEGEALASQSGHRVVALRAFLRRPWLWPHPCVLSVQHMHAFAEAEPKRYVKAVSEFRRKYRGRSGGAGQVIAISVHLRRGDVSASSHPDRYTDPGKVLAALRHVLAGCQRIGRPVTATVFSQGVRSDFEDFEAAGCRFQLDGDPLDAMQELVASNILITSKSSFSYVAGLLCSGSVVYEPFWHRPLPHWLVMGEDGIRLELSTRSDGDVLWA